MTSSEEADAQRIEQALTRSANPPGTRLFALIDLANVASEAVKLHRDLVRSNAVCVFGDPSPSAQLASPWLLPLEGVPEGNKPLRRSVELALRSSAVTWLLTRLPGHELGRRLQVRTEIQLPDRYDALLRHFDPRVLPVIHRVLDTSQREVFFSLGHAWHYLDRAATMTEIALAPAPDVDGFKAPMQLDDEQVAALLDAAEVDAVMPELVKEEVDRFLALGNGFARYRFTEHWLGRARHWKLEQFPQKVVLCTLALRLGPDFDEQPAWREALRRVANRDVRFSEAIEQATRTAYE